MHRFSLLSASLYDDGYPNVTNVDFEEKVIADMSRAHIRARPLMRWRVMDMTAMRGLSDSSFDAIIDKGAMGELSHCQQCCAVRMFFAKVFTVLAFVSMALLLASITVCSDCLQPCAN